MCKWYCICQPSETKPVAKPAAKVEEDSSDSDESSDDEPPKPAVKKVGVVSTYFMLFFYLQKPCSFDLDCLLMELLTSLSQLRRKLLKWKRTAVILMKALMKSHQNPKLQKRCVCFIFQRNCYIVC